MPQDNKSERNLEILHLHEKEGWTYQAIADVYGLTRQRVHAIISRFRKPCVCVANDSGNGGTNGEAL